MAEISDAELFVAIAREGSVSAGARALGVSRATAQRRLVAMEQRLGVRLLHRDTHQSAVTEAGRAFVERAEGALAALKDAEDAARHFREAPRGKIRLAAPPLSVDELIAPILIAFAQRYPEIELELVLTDDLSNLIAHGYDLGLGVADITAQNASCVARSLLHARFVLIASPDYLASRGTPRDPDALRGHDCLVSGRIEMDLTHWPLRDGGAALLGRQRLISNSPEMLIRAAMAGLGIGYVGAVLVRDELADGRLVEVLPEVVGATYAVSLLYPARELLSPAVRAFIDFAGQWVDRYLGRPGPMQLRVDAP